MPLSSFVQPTIRCVKQVTERNGGHPACFVRNITPLISQGDPDVEGSPHIVYIEPSLHLRWDGITGLKQLQVGQPETSGVLGPDFPDVRDPASRSGVVNLERLVHVAGLVLQRDPVPHQAVRYPVLSRKAWIGKFP